MKAEIIMHEQMFAVDLNAPIIEVSAKSDGYTINVTGGVGPQGPRGYSPLRGLDYWTEDDVTFIVRAAINAVLDAYPAAEEENW